MKDYEIEKLGPILASGNSTVVIHGAGLAGRQVLYAFSVRNIKVSYFVDSDESLQDKMYCGVKTISAERLSEIAPNSHIFIAHDFLVPVIIHLKNLNFKNIYNTFNLLNSTDFSEGNEYTKRYPEWTVTKINRFKQIHKFAADKAKRILNTQKPNYLTIKHIDIVITDRCSMKCRDCANLMQFYVKPENSDINLLLKSVDRLMQCVDKLYEFRVIGGEPFMNKEIYKIVNKLVEYNNAEIIAIFTNATIIPKGNNLECLINDKVHLQITNYGKLSKKHDEIVALLDKNNVKYVSDRLKLWDDIGRIKYEKKNEKQLNELFTNCCANDIYTLLDGTLYKCPVSAHGTKLKAIPYNADFDGINLNNEHISLNELKSQLIDFHDNNKYVTACNYCQGRGYGFGTIEAAIQTKTPLPYDKIDSII